MNDCLGSRNEINQKIKGEEKKTIVSTSLASGTVCASDLDGCGAVLYMYLNNRSDTLRGMPPPRSDSYREKKED
uniref:SFRICE_013278 n=1 Tax=Spodoptera frugiperda TaxID=7108 RepID=A0A2H1WET3_SPOFR